MYISIYCIYIYKIKIIVSIGNKVRIEVQFYLKPITL